MCMKNRWRTDACLAACGVLIWFLADAARVRAAAVEALALCGRSVIPALFPFLAVSGLLISLGFGQWLAPLFSGLMAPLFRLPGQAAGPLLLGLIGGYPIGAQTAAGLYREGQLTAGEAERLLTFCNNSNPVFLVSVLGVGVFGSVRAGVWLWLIHVASALLTGLFFRGHGKRGSRERVSRGIPFQALSLSTAFVGSIRDAAGGMLSVCAFVVFFYVLARPLAAAGPLANLLACCTVLLYMQTAGRYSYGGYWFACTNLLVGGANLLPLPGLDGAHILHGMFYSLDKRHRI